MNETTRSHALYFTVPRPVRWTVVCAAAALIGCTHAQTLSPQRYPSRVMIGAFVGDKNWQEGYVRHARITRREPDLLLTFTPWAQRGAYPFPEAFCRFAIEHKAVPIITWEPWEPWNRWHPRLADIAAGVYDRQIVDWAGRAARLKRPILVRFAHEMNGDWYPWSVRKDPRQTPADYVAAWRHVHELFRAQAADNLQLVWSPNFEPTRDLRRLYPGDDVVDWVGLDMYNRPEWPRPPAVMMDPVCRFAEHHGKPVILTEVGCAERFADPPPSDEHARWRNKKLWIEALFRAIADRPIIRGMVWFDMRKEADWRIESSPWALTAYRQGLSLLDRSRSWN